MRHRLSSLYGLSSLGILLAACHGGGTSAPAAKVDFAVVAFTEGNFAYLDDPIAVVFSASIDPTTANADSVIIAATAGPGLGIAARGRFEVADGALANDTLRFWPELPLGEDLTTGLLADTSYSVTVAGAALPALLPLRDAAGRPLSTGVQFSITMPAAGTFRPSGSGPTVTAAIATPLDDHGQWLPGSFAGGPAELQLTFAQALDPTAANLPRQPTEGARGPLQLRYDDPEFGQDSWIPASVVLLTNSWRGATVVLRPIGVLPTAARVRVLVTAQLRTLGGQDHSEPGYQGEVATVDTLADYRPRFDALAARFASDQLDADANFGEPMAQVEDGALRSAEPPLGAGSGFDWQPTLAETIVNTDFVEWVPTSGPVQTPADGVVRVHDFHLPAGRSMRGIGSKPLVIVCDGEFVVDGELSVSGGNAAARGIHAQYRGPGEVTPPLPANWPGPIGDPPNYGDPLLQRSAGGIGVCGGGHGGRRGPPPGDPWLINRAMTGRPGFGPGNVPGAGGQPGRIACAAGCGRGSGGGGGSMATQGDPWYPAAGVPANPTSFQQIAGIGGQGCAGASGAATRALTGGAAGPVVFVDPRHDNDFWGTGFDVHRQIRIRGELARPSGGGGGAGGGDLSNSEGCSPTAAGWLFDSWGGDGGGGGGVLIVQASGRIVIGPTGHIRADGGDGRGGDQGSSSNVGGGGGGGAGGMVVLMSGDRIVLHRHGETYANRDYNFAISADGGVCRTGTLSTPVVAGKYPANGNAVMPGTSYDAAPLGGFGGMGLIQLQAPLGGSNQDGTNTVLDDAIDVLDAGGQPLTGADKQRYLAWRGIADATGTMVDDFGVPVAIGNREGDLRPAPVLLPAPFGSRSRARSRWQSLGAVPRRPLPAADGLARGVVSTASNRGPQFAGQRLEDGWLPWRAATSGFVADAEAELATPVPVLAAAAADLHGHPTFRLDLGRILSSSEGRFTGYQAELLGPTGELLRTLTIRQSDGSTVWLDADNTLPSGISSLQIRRWFVAADFGGAPSPARYAGANAAPVPQGNLRLCFAFHRDPEHAASSGYDAGRLPHEVGTFWSDLQASAVQQQLSGFGATHVMWDITLEQAFRSSAGDQPQRWDFHTPPLRLLRLLLPFRY